MVDASDTLCYLPLGRTASTLPPLALIEDGDISVDFGRSVLIRRPLALSAVAILQTNGGADDARLSDALVASGVAVVCISERADFAAGLQLAADEFDMALPRIVAASGSSVAVAQRAARRAGLTGALLLNAPVGAAIGRRSLDTMLFVDRELLSARLWGRLASWLGHASFQIVDGSLTAPVQTWLANPAEVVREPLGIGSTVGAFAASAAIVALPLIAAPATAGADPFDAGVSVSSHHISGDGSGARTADSESDAQEGQAVPASAITGDGTTLVAPSPTGSIGLVGGNHMKWFINTNITFSTTSSASGAASEGEFTQAVNATTSAGGTVTSSLNDAFDGHQSLFVDVAGTLVATSSPNNVYNKTGAAPTADANCPAEQYLFPVKSMMGLDVSRSVFVPADQKFARWVNTFHNPTMAPITFATGSGNNLGSDANTIITTTSDGNNTAETTDTWIASMQNYSGTTSSDVRLANVIQGPGASVAPSGVSFVDGDDNPDWSWDITVQPGETVSIMNFVVGAATKAEAAATAAQLAALDTTIRSTDCIDLSATGTIVNFAADPEVTVAPVTVNETDGTATVTFTRAVAGPAATVTFTVTAGTATAGSDYTDPASFTANFAAGSTTATATIPITNDALVEPDETLTVTITGVTGFASIGATTVPATVTIVSEDVPATTTTTIRGGILPPTGSTSSGNVAWFAALFAGVGAVFVRLTRRRRPV